MPEKPKLPNDLSFQEMRLFAELYAALDETTKTNVKIEALVEYFKKAPPEDAIWAISFLIGRKPKQIIPSRKMRKWAAELAEISDWLFDESYDVVGDLAETITLLLPQSRSTSDIPLNIWVRQRLLPLRDKGEDQQKKEIISAWKEMSTQQRFVFNKLITGGFRVGVSQNLVVRGFSKYSGIDQAVIAHRLMGSWEPTSSFYHKLLSQDTHDADISRPYPSFLACPLENNPEELGNIEDWQVEWKWDGIRAQLIKRNKKVFIWSRGQELVTNSYPELKEMAEKLSDGIAIDGEIVPWKDNKPLNFADLQRRIGRKTVSAKIMQEVPVAIISYDLLEFNGEDIRQKPLHFRNRKLSELIADISDSRLIHSPEVKVKSWHELSAKKEESRKHGTEGLMLKNLNSPYRRGRKRGDWWKWKVDPLFIDAVLIYAQRGHGKRASLYTDYTFAVWDEKKLVPFTKAYSGLTDKEIREVDQFIRSNTIGRFGPVRSVKPELVFEIAFEGIQKSSRHKSGVAVRFPRMARCRTDKKTEDADTIQTLRALLNE